MAQLQAKKSLGQNFLVDKKALSRIAEAAAIAAGDTVIEIGPGTGLLTHELLRSELGRLICYEVDERAVSLLRDEIKDERIEIREQDFLEADLTEISKEKLRVVGNIPYYITSPIIFKLIDDRAFVKDAVLLVQLEVAERLTASPRTKEYGIPTVLTNFFGEVKLLFKVKAGSFRPVPKVDSALVRIDLMRDYFTRNSLNAPQGFDAPGFQRFVRNMFAMRRKTLRNNLKAVLDQERITLLENDVRLSRYLTLRAEELVIPDFLELYGGVTS
jgi:16S rRNA (adenine1518-N6/adenine1519-N6)-dimethyltransferase